MLGSTENLENISGLENLFKMQSNLSNAKMMSTGKLEDDHLSIIKWNDRLLENRYLQKTSYQIISGMLTQKENYVIEAPQDIESSIQNFETGQVYEVLYKDQLGNFQPFVRTNQIQAAIKKDDDNEFDNIDFDQDKNEESGNESAQQTKFLIYIVNQPLNFNEEAVTITFFKDITFGVLYEQIKAQDELQSVITNNLDKKIGNKLKKISQNVDNMMKDK